MNLHAGETEQKATGTELKKENSEQKDKTENVYVKADASGAVQETTVETVLKGEQGGKEIQDFSTLREIKDCMDKIMFVTVYFVISSINVAA